MALPLDFNSFNCVELNHKSKINYSYYDNDCYVDDVCDFQSLNERTTRPADGTPSANAAVPESCMYSIPLPMPKCSANVGSASRSRVAAAAEAHSCNLFVRRTLRRRCCCLFCHLLEVTFVTRRLLRQPTASSIMMLSVTEQTAAEEDYVDIAIGNGAAHAAYLFKVLWPDPKDLDS